MRKKLKLYMAIVMFAFIFVGCSSTELEERCFPMVVTVGYEDGKVSYGAGFPKDEAAGQSDTKGTEIKMTIVSDPEFAKCKEKYENRLNKEVDYNHLKVLALEDDLLEQPQSYEGMLDQLAELEEFPRNTYVCVVDDIEELFELEGTIAQDLGTYLEEYLKLHEEKKDRLLTLGDLIDEKENKTFILYLPYLEVEDNFIEWKGYVNTTGKKWKES